MSGSSSVAVVYLSRCICICICVTIALGVAFFIGSRGRSSVVNDLIGFSDRIPGLGIITISRRVPLLGAHRGIVSFLAQILSGIKIMMLRCLVVITTVGSC